VSGGLFPGPGAAPAPPRRAPVGACPLASGPWSGAGDASLRDDAATSPPRRAAEATASRSWTGPAASSP